MRRPGSSTGSIRIAEARAAKAINLFVSMADSILMNSISSVFDDEYLGD